MQVRDPIAASLHMPSVGDSELVNARVDDLIELLALGAYRDKFVRELSTGTRRVVDLACVLAQGPTVLLLDEPSSGIAQREAEALAPMLRRVRDQLGASLLVVEHDLPLLEISDRMIALDLGRIVAEGPPPVIEHPAVVASYLGTDEAAITRSRHQLPPVDTPAPPRPSPTRRRSMKPPTSEGRRGRQPARTRRLRRHKALKRYGPIALVVILLVGAFIVFGGGGVVTTTTTAPSTTATPARTS